MTTKTEQNDVKSQLGGGYEGRVAEKPLFTILKIQRPDVAFSKRKNFSNKEGEGRWSEDEHERFVEAIKLLGCNWELI